MPTSQPNCVGVTQKKQRFWWGHRTMTKSVEGSSSLLQSPKHVLTYWTITVTRSAVSFVSTVCCRVPFSEWAQETNDGAGLSRKRQFDLRHHTRWENRVLSLGAFAILSILVHTFRTQKRNIQSEWEKCTETFTPSFALILGLSACKNAGGSHVVNGLKHAIIICLTVGCCSFFVFSNCQVLSY